MTTNNHPVVKAIGPLLSRIGATVIDPAQLSPQDVPLEWKGDLIAGIRLAPAGLDPDREQMARDTAAPGASPVGAVEPAGGIDVIIGDVERHFGTPLTELSRERKQQAVRMFEEGGAFSYRKSVEAVAAALGVSRFTVYNYLNRDRG